MRNLIVFITAIIFTIQIHRLDSKPLNDNARLKRSDGSLLPNESFTMITNEKLMKLKDLAKAKDDPKLHDLYRAVNHYVQIARKNNEYVLWKYDANREGLVLVLKPNLNGILHYG
ncbi:unnamed protein product [Adineta steineri]|uniref:Uncharacterized protein n=1 Tax=Adineta steineri TaxID=433720 RepID=A0A819EB88_9BILA|nr:unnamed protein product [Adineta steineri]CAF1448073.1 unnamed protein product [Adineta steineri]CAF3847470.1 unnamed protein product [Adineta steineri]CAF4043515.1 unnamed protein product [Adineta steineri]